MPANELGLINDKESKNIKQKQSLGIWIGKTELQWAVPRLLVSVPGNRLFEFLINGSIHFTCILESQAVTFI